MKKSQFYSKKLFVSLLLMTLMSALVTNAYAQRARDFGAIRPISAGASEIGELLILNNCEEDVELELEISPTSESTSVMVPAGGSSAHVIDFPEPSTGKNRSHVRVTLDTETPTGPCFAPGLGTVQVAYSIMGPMGLVQAVSATLSHKLYVGYLSWDAPSDGLLFKIGDKQSAEIVVANNCGHEVKFHYVVRDVKSGEDSVSDKATLASNETAVIPLDDGHMDWVQLNSLYQGPLTPRTSGGVPSSSSNECVKASVNVFDSVGGETGMGLLLPAVQQVRER